MAGTVVKVTLNDETRRFDLIGASFSDFKKMIVDRFSVFCDDFSVQYRDDDGDLVTVSSDAELREAIDGAKTTVKFVVSGAISSSPSDPSDVQGRKSEKRECDLSESDGGRHGRKGSKKISKKEEKEAKKESLKREVLDELRKELGAKSTFGGASSQGPANHTGMPASGQIPSGEKLQALLQAAVESFGIPPAAVYDHLNGLTPESVRSSLNQRAPVTAMLRMFLGRFASPGGPSNPSAPSDPSFSSPPFPPPPPPHTGGPGGPGYWHGPPPPWGGAPWPHHRHHHGYHHGPPSSYGHPFNFHQGTFPSEAGGGEPPQSATSSTPTSIFGGWCGGRSFGNPVGFTSVDKIPSPPPAPLSIGSCGEDVTALQTALITLGFLQCGPWYLFKKHFGKRTMEALYRFQVEHGLVASGVYDNETRAMLISKIESIKESSPKESVAKDSSTSTTLPNQTASDVGKVVDLVDTDGDNIRFVLSEDGRKVIEYVNGKVELDSVTYLHIDELKGMVFDPLGKFTLRDEDRVEKLKALQEIFAKVGIVPTNVSAGQASVPAATVEIDLDFSATPERIMEQQRIASDAIRKACSSLGGVTADAAHNVLAQLFEAVTSGKSEARPVETKHTVETKDEQGGTHEQIPEKEVSCEETDVEFKFQQQLVDVLEMGFDDVDLITSLLAKHNGNVSRVVADLADHRSV